MKKHCKENTPPGSRKRECLPCDIPQLCRNNYFTGKLLTQRDFTTEQTYMIDKLRLHNVALHGWGIVCGLKVIPHPLPKCLRIRVEPGLAIDCCGREIRVLGEVDLIPPEPKMPAPEDEEPCPPEPKQETQESAPAGKMPPPYQQEEPDEEPEKPVESCPPQPPRYPLYVCLRYVECESEFMPAPFDECACGNNGQKPARICQSYELEVLTERPSSFDLVEKLKNKCAIDDCESLYWDTLEGCLGPCDLDCIPLAIINDYTPGEKITEEMIDNWTYRVVLPSTTVLDQVIRCILGKLPTHKLTRIQDYNWEHNAEYGCHEFMEEFVGTEENPRAFWVEFDGPLFRAGLNRRTFEAIVVRYPDKGGPGRPEVALLEKPRWNEENTRVHLALNYHYAQTLHRLRFDLFLRLRCNFLVDINGRPVDGELQAQLDEDKDNYSLGPYTGDGIPGGLFESWIRVLA